MIIRYPGKKNKTIAVHKGHSTFFFMTLGIKIHINVYLFLLGLFTKHGSVRKSEESRKAIQKAMSRTLFKTPSPERRLRALCSPASRAKI